MNRNKLRAMLFTGLMAMLPLQTVRALTVDAITVDASGALNFTLSNDDDIAYGGIIIETPFTSIDQFQLGGGMPAAWTQAYSLTSGNVLSIYAAPIGSGMGIGQTHTFTTSFVTSQIPSITDFLDAHGGTFTITAFSGLGNFTQDYVLGDTSTGSLGSSTVPLPASWSLLVAALGLLGGFTARKRSG